MSASRESLFDGRSPLLAALHGPEERQAIAQLDVEIERVLNKEYDSEELIRARGAVLARMVALSRLVDALDCGSPANRHEWRGQWLDGNRVRWYCVHCRKVEMVRDAS